MYTSIPVENEQCETFQVFAFVLCLWVAGKVMSQKLWRDWNANFENYIAILIAKSDRKSAAKVIEDFSKVKPINSSIIQPIV